jgi:hypothetical protein
VDGGWPGSCHEHKLIALAGLEGLLDEVEVASLLDRGFGRGLAKGRQHWHAPVGDRRSKDRLSHAQQPFNRVQAGVHWWSRRSGTWPTRGRCVAGAGCCTGAGVFRATQRAGLPGTMAAPSTDVKQHHGHPQSPPSAMDDVGEETSGRL